MNFEGFQPHKIARWGGQVDWDDPTQLPNGVAIVSRNSRFLADSVATRFGQRRTIFKAGTAGDVTGFDFLQVLGAAEQQVGIIYSNSGILLRETPPGSGTLVPITTPVPLVSGALMQTALAYNRIYMAFGDLIDGLGPPLVLDGPTGNISVVSQNPVGEFWTPGRFYQIGDAVRTNDGTGRWFRCTRASLAGNTEPAWPTSNGNFVGGVFVASQVLDADPGGVNGITIWEEWTPACKAFLPPPDTANLNVIISHNPGLGSIPAGRDIYIQCAYLHPKTGEGQRSQSLLFNQGTGTSLNDQILVQFRNAIPLGGGPEMPRWLAEIIIQSGLFYAFTLNIYVANVAHGAAPPAQNQYFLYAHDQPIDSSLTINSAPASNSQTFTQGGAIMRKLFVALGGGGGSAVPDAPAVFTGETGLRYLMVLRLDANDSLSPVDPGSPFAVQFTNGAPQPFAFLPPPIDDTTTNIAAFTVAGQSQAGPYFYINKPDPLNPVTSSILIISRLTNVVTAVLQDGTGFLSGQTIIDAGTTPSTFNGTFVIATVNGNTVTWPQTAGNGSGSAGGISVQQQLVTINVPVDDFPINFSDDFLAASLDVTSQLTAIPAPPVADIYYCPSLRKMVYTGTKDFPTHHLFSRTDDPGNIDGAGGILAVEASNGAKAICVREMRSGEILSIKENGGYAISPTDLSPGQWGLAKRWDKHGPPAARWVYVGRDFLIFGCQEGAFRYDGSELVWVSEEFTGTWGRINWPATEGWIVVEEVAKLVRFGVPLDGATTPSHELTLDYAKGWERPVTLSYTGEVVVNRSGRRWNINDIAARCAGIARRTLATPADPQINDRQMLYGMANNGGLVVNMEQPNVYDDAGVGIDWRYRPSYAGSGALGILRFAGVSGRVRGKGLLQLDAQTDEPNFAVATEKIDLKDNTNNIRFARGIRLDNEILSYEFNNGKVAGSWAELQDAIIWSRPLFSARIA